MYIRVERRYEVLEAMEAIRSRNTDDTRTLQEILAELLPPFAPVEDKSVPEEA